MVAYRIPEPIEAPHFTPEEYLERERKAPERSEYLNGVIVAMSGASWEHSLITGDIEAALNVQCRGTSCAPVSKDQRVRVEKCNSYFYPDIVVVCGTPQFDARDRPYSILNPIVLIEVLSESTAHYDRDAKWECYQTLESLQTYVLVAQNRPRVEVYQRKGSVWEYTAYIGLESAVPLESVGCSLSMTEIYARVELPAPSSETAESEGVSTEGT